MGFTDARPCWGRCKWPMGFPSFFLWTKKQVFHKPLKVRPFSDGFSVPIIVVWCVQLSQEYSEFEVSISIRKLQINRAKHQQRPFLPYCLMFIL